MPPLHQFHQAKLSNPDTERPASANIVWHAGKVSAADRAQLLRQKPATIWLTGLSGAGKSTLAFALEKRLIAGNHLAFVLDGDNVRHGLNRDLGFSADDRSENIRRIAEVARMFNEAGVMVITAFISPFRKDRALAREIIGAERFIETHVCTPIDVCEHRDPKGLYEKARHGKIDGFTGISAPYEAPQAPDLRIDTGRLTVEQSVAQIIQKLMPRLY